jgi:hypothetical protein
VLLLWDIKRRRYRICVPEQEATVRESFSGRRFAIDVSYTIPLSLPSNHLIAGDIHCHGDMSAYSSWADEKDEKYRDGIHVVVGKIDREPPEFHVELSVDGGRFPLKFDDLFRGYSRRRVRFAPREWFEKFKVKVEKQTWSPISSRSDASYGNYWYDRERKKRWYPNGY